MKFGEGKEKVVSKLEWQRVEGVSGGGKQEVSASLHTYEICRARLRERLFERYGEATGRRCDGCDLAGFGTGREAVP